MIRIEGREAVEFAEQRDLPLCMYNSPILDAREDLSLSEAEGVLAEDPSLIYLDVPALIRIGADPENNAEAWWEAAYQADREGRAPRLLIPLLTYRDFVLVSPEEAEEIKAWAMELPGWDDGPFHAREALLIQEIA